MKKQPLNPVKSGFGGCFSGWREKTITDEKIKCCKPAKGQGNASPSSLSRGLRLLRVQVSKGKVSRQWRISSSVGRAGMEPCRVVVMEPAALP